MNNVRYSGTPYHGWRNFFEVMIYFKFLPVNLKNILFYEYLNSYFRYKCEKVILSSWGRLRPSEARLKRPHRDKITFSLAYRTQFFHTTCAKLDLAHAVLFERAQSDTLRTECEKKVFWLDKNQNRILSEIRKFFPLGDEEIERALRVSRGPENSTLI